MPWYSTSNPTFGEETGAPHVEISTKRLGIDDFAGEYKDDRTPNEDVWTDYRVLSRYEWDMHTCMMGVTSPRGFLGAGAAFVQLAAPTLLWIVDWTASRFGLPPSIPEPAPSSKNLWVLMDYQTEPALLIVGPDGVTPLYRISGTYVYGCLNPNAATMTFPKPPYLEMFGARRVLVNGDYIRGVIMN